jgi:hypothetical protein
MDGCEVDWHIDRDSGKHTISCNFSLSLMIMIICSFKLPFDYFSSVRYLKSIHPTVEDAILCFTSYSMDPPPEIHENMRT